MLPSPFNYTSILGTTTSVQAQLGCKSGLDRLGMGARSHYDYAFGSSMNLPIQGSKLCAECSSNLTGPKRWRPAFYANSLESCGKCSTIDPTDPCSYGNTEMGAKSECNFGWARTPNNWNSPIDGNRFSSYRWG